MFSGLPIGFTPILIFLGVLGITFWVWDELHFGRTTRAACSVLAGIIAIILGIFIYSGYSYKHAAGVMLFEGFFLALQFAISHVAHAAKTPS